MRMRSKERLPKESPGLVVCLDQFLKHMIWFYKLSIVVQFQESSNLKNNLIIITVNEKREHSQ